MRNLILVLALAVPLAGCGLLTGIASVPPAPVAVADRTVLDEQAALSVELAYQAATVAVGAAADAGILRGDNALKAAAIDKKAYQAVLKVRAAYDAGNATGYGAALAIARTEIGSLLALIS